VCLFNATGKSMLETGRRQAENFGSQFMDEDILKIIVDKDRFTLETEGGDQIECNALIVATGTARNTLRVKGEKEFIGKGVSYCVDCDGNFYRGEEVVVVGSESTAADGALTLAEIAGNAHLICDDLKVSEPCSGKSMPATSSFTKVPKSKRLSVRSRSMPWFLMTAQPCPRPVFLSSWGPKDSWSWPLHWVSHWMIRCGSLRLTRPSERVCPAFLLPVISAGHLGRWQEQWVKDVWPALMLRIMPKSYRRCPYIPFMEEVTLYYSASSGSGNTCWNDPRLYSIRSTFLFFFKPNPRTTVIKDTGYALEITDRARESLRNMRRFVH